MRKGGEDTATWRHLRNDLRAFAVDAIGRAEILDSRAKDVAEKWLDEVLCSGYGIFTCDNVTGATLRFTPERSRWVAAERWHPMQEGTLRKDGSFARKLPYADDRELIMDTLRYVADCPAVSPKALRDRVVAEIDRARARYPS